MTNEHYTLGKCVPQLESTLRLDATAMASYLFSQGFITDSLYEEILDPRSTFDGAEKATKLVIEIMRKVKLEPGNYYKFINHLRQDMRKYGDIVDILDAEYFGIRRLQQPTGGQKAVSSDDLHKELTSIKDKWYSIGTGLMVPSGHLDKFHGLTDPLMEVIVHWLKGSRDTPPSWEGVVLALKEPGVDEAELAGKINRLYCDHREEEKAVEEKKGQAPPSELTSNLDQVTLKANYRHLADSNKEFERYKLEKKTKDIKRSYSKFLAQLHQRMLVLQRSGDLTVAMVKSHMISFDWKLKAPLSSCSSLPEIFEVLTSPERSSFLDYEHIKVLHDLCDTEKTRSDFVEYKKKLQKFLEARVIEDSSGGEKSFAVVIDESITDEIQDLAQLHNRVKMILGHKDVTLVRWENRNLPQKSSPAATAPLAQTAMAGTIPSPPLLKPEVKSDTPHAGIGEDTTQSSEEDASSVVAEISESPELDLVDEAVPNLVMPQGANGTTKTTPTPKKASTIVVAIDESQLDIDDLGDVLDEVETLASKWRILSTKLRLKESSLDVIEQNHSKDVVLCLHGALGEWLRLNYNHQKHGRPSWKRLAEAVKNLDYALFEAIASNHPITI